MASSLNVLVFSRTCGYRHASIPAGIAALKRLGVSSNPSFTVEATEDAGIFTPEDLSKFRVLVLLHVSGEFLSLNQLDALKHFVHTGGGIVGIHSASVGMPSEAPDCVDKDGWYRRLIGAAFAGHPPPQTGVIRAMDTTHPILARGLRGDDSGLKLFDKESSQREFFDEWYNFKVNPSSAPDIHVLLTVDEATYEGGTLGSNHPIAWCQEFEGGRVFHTALGHFDAAYEEEMFLGQVMNGIFWVSNTI